MALTIRCFVCSLIVVWMASCADVSPLGADDAGVSSDGLSTVVWERISSGTSRDLMSVHGIDVQHVWAAGASGTLLSYDGFNWKTNHSPTDRDLNAVFAASKDQTWAMGSLGIVLHAADGSSWFQDGTFPHSNDLLGIWGSGPNDVWGVGARGLVVRHSGAGWQQSYTPTGIDIVALWGLGANNIYAVAPGDVFWFNGDSWRRVYNSVTEFTGVWASSSEGVWVVGRDGSIRHYNGTTWKVDHREQGVELVATWGRDQTVYAVGKQDGVGVILRRENGQWLSERFIEKKPAPINAIWGDSAGLETWAVGDGGAIYRRSR